MQHANASRSNPALIWLVILVVLLTGFTGAGILAAEKPTGSVTGIVLDNQGQALVNASVHFMGSVTRTAKTGDDGSFRMDRLPIGRYNVQARARGYEGQWSSPPILVEEGKTLEGLKFSLSPRAPSLTAAQFQRVFTPADKVRIGVRGTLIDRMHVKLYQLDLDRVVQNSNSLMGLTDRNPAELGERAVLIREWDREIGRQAADEDDWFYRAIEIKDLSPGAYMMQMDGTSDLRRPGMPHTAADSYWFEVTQVAMVAKRSGNESLVYAVDFLTKKPLPGVQVRAFDDRGLRWTATTNAEGLIRRTYQGKDSLLLVGKLGDSPAHAQSYYYSGYQEFRVLTYTDRPIYRPDQEVFYKGIIRQDELGKIVNRANLPVTVQVLDPQENMVHEVHTRTNAIGTFNGKLTLGSEPPLGDYRLVALVAGNRYESMFKVQEYRKPEFKLEVQTPQQRYVSGETAKAVVSANYYFGAPVTGAKINYTVYSRPYSPWVTEEDAFYANFGGVDDFAWGYSNVVMQGEATTDDAGHVTLNIPTEIHPDPQGESSDQRYIVELEGVDASRQVVKGKGGFLVTRGAFTLEASPDRYVYQPSAKGNVTVRAQDYDGKPIETDVQVELLRIEYIEREVNDITQFETKTHPAGSWSARTDAQGRATLGFEIPKEGGEYRLRAKSRDQGGREITESAWLWVADEDWAGSSQTYGMVQLTFDKKRYAPGDVAKVLVQLPNAEVSPLITIEGQRIYGAQVLGAGKRSRIVEIPVTKDYEPNVFVVASVVDGKSFHLAEKSLNVTPGDRFLDVRIVPGKERYLPGEEASLTVTTRNADGQPVSAEVSLGVVDEAIYALAPDETPDIRAVFHGPRWNRISTSYSFVEDYSGGPGKDTEEPRVRKNFKDTAAWFPDVQTGPGGSATVNFTLPDNLTTWVVTARAVNAQTQVGAAREKFLATKDLLVRLAMPRFMVMGDKVAIATMVHNYTKQEQEVRLQTAATNLTFGGGAERTIKVPSNGIFRFDTWVEPQAVGTASMTVTARGTGASDALELSLPVLPHGTPERTAFAGQASEAQPAEFVVELPKEAIAETVSLKLSLDPTPAAAMLGALDYLRRYPYGCIEQTTSRFVPEIRAYQTVSALGLPRPAFVAEMPKLVEDGLKQIVSFQHADGGWGWFAADQSEADLSAYVLYGLYETRQAGFMVPEAPVRSAIRYLKSAGSRIGKDVVIPTEVRRGAGPDTLASIAWSLSYWGQADTNLRDKLWRERNSLSNYGLALATIAYQQSGDPQKARTTWDMLKRQASRTGTLVHWESRAQRYSWYDMATETTAYAVRAGLLVEPTSPEVTGAVRWLVVNRQGDRWLSTKDTGAIVMALADAMRYATEAGIPTGAQVLLDGQPIERLDLQGEARYLGGQVTLAGDALKPGRHTLTVRAEGMGELPASGVLSYVAAREDIQSQASKELSIQREYFLLDEKLFAESKAEGGGFSRYFDPKVVSGLRRVGDNVKSGQKVLVRLTVDVKEPVRYMVLEDPLPAGAEVLDEPSGGWAYAWSSQTVRDEKMVFFQREMATGSVQFYYVMRPQIPGLYHALPPVIEGMYAPEVRARGAETRLEIRE
jgi:uncharacterized protein YfaS (alpha-2-macroglobulin family)